jgi:hypothetical protein
MAGRAEAGADVVAASRYMRGGQQIGGPWLKGVMSRAAGLSLHWLAGLPTHDPTNSFKAYRKDFLDVTPVESAAGFSLGLERIIVLMTERNMFPPAVAGGAVDIVVTLWNDELRGSCVALAAELRQKGLRVDLYPEADKLGKQFKYADSRKAPFVAILGDDERAKGEVAVKDLRSGDQTSMPRDQVAGFVAANRERRT